MSSSQALDFSLLNFWTGELHLDIRHEDLNKPPRLYLGLKATIKDPVYTHVILLSNDKKQILDFFGFDTSIEYDLLSEQSKAISKIKLRGCTKYTMGKII